SSLEAFNSSICSSFVLASLRAVCSCVRCRSITFDWRKQIVASVTVATPKITVKKGFFIKHDHHLDLLLLAVNAVNADGGKFSRDKQGSVPIFPRPATTLSSSG